MQQSELFQTAVKKAKSGERKQAREMLLELVEHNPRHELAWLWLSELVEDLEDKIIALENALTINPQRPQARQKLHRLRQKYEANREPTSFPFADNGQPQFYTTEEATFAEIEQLFKAKQLAQGRQELADFLRRYSNHEAGWWLMVCHADSQANLLTSLDHLLRLNAQHPEAPAIIEKIKPTNEEYLQMGRLHERLEQWETAVYYYKRALRSPNNADRLLAKKHLPAVEEQVRLANIKFTSPVINVMRLSVGPTLLYGLLMMVQAGLRPLQVSPILCLGNVMLLAGLLIISGLAYHPEHPWLQQLREWVVFENAQTLRFIAIVCILLPILLLLLLSLNRLLAFDLDLSQIL